MFLSYYLAVDVRADEHGNGVGPGDAGVLVPPALHDDGDVEAQHEGERDEVAVCLAVLHHGLEHPAEQHRAYLHIPRVGVSRQLIRLSSNAWTLGTLAKNKH